MDRENELRSRTEKRTAFPEYTAGFRGLTYDMGRINSGISIQKYLIGQVDGHRFMDGLAGWCRCLNGFFNCVGYGLRWSGYIRLHLYMCCFAVKQTVITGIGNKSTSTFRATQAGVCAIITAVIAMIVLPVLLILIT